MGLMKKNQIIRVLRITIKEPLIFLHTFDKFIMPIIFTFKIHYSHVFLPVVGDLRKIKIIIPYTKNISSVPYWRRAKCNVLS